MRTLVALQQPVPTHHCINNVRPTAATDQPINLTTLPKVIEQRSLGLQGGAGHAPKII